jgi:hypothetical protein
VLFHPNNTPLAHDQAKKKKEKKRRGKLASKARTLKSR